MTEEELTDLCKVGNRAAQQQLYCTYAGRLFKICMRYVGDRQEAEDLLHDGFLHIYNSIVKFTWRGEGSLRAWLEKVMVNEVLSYIRKKKEYLIISPETIKEEDESEDVDEDEIEKIPMQVLLELINQLPMGYKTVFNLFVFEEKSHKEIADLLGIKEKTSTSQYFRAKTLLAKKVNGWLKEHDR